MSNDLELIFQMQDKLNSRFGMAVNEASKLPDSDKLTWIRNYLQAASVEISEALVEAGSRWWKTKPVEYDKLREEIIDVSHFLFSSYMLAGGTHDMFFNEYKKKNEKNNVRTDWNKVEEKTDDREKLL